MSISNAGLRLSFLQRAVFTMQTPIHSFLPVFESINTSWCTCTPSAQAEPRFYTVVIS
jgi:hypothetical protein